MRSIKRYFTIFFNVWIKEFSIWAFKAKLVGIGLFVVIGIVYLGVFTWCSEPSIKFSGYILQLFGTSLAIKGLLDIRLYFAQPPLRQVMVDWFKRFPQFITRIEDQLNCARIRVSSNSIRFEEWKPDKPNESIEERLQKIQFNLSYLKKTQNEIIENIELFDRDFNDFRAGFVKQMESLKKEIQSDLELLHTNNIVTALIGIVWIFIGSSMSTMAPEIFKLMQ